MSTRAERRARLAVRLYPPSWRERYEDEFLALLADRPLTPRASVDAARGALDAWVRPRPGREPSEGLRACVSVVWCAWIAAAAGGLLFGQSIEDAPFRHFDRAHPLARVLYTVYAQAAHLSVAAVLVGALAVVYPVARLARAGGPRRPLALLAVPLLASVGFLVCLVVIARLVPHSPTPGVGVGATWFLVLAGLGLLAGVACAAAPALALRRVMLPPAALRVAVLAAAAATVAMALAATASAAYEVVLHRVDPSFAAANSQPMVLTVPYLALMAAACAVAGVSARRGLRRLRPVPPAA